MNYESPVRYEKARIHAAALYCSDGRVGEHFDDFLQSGLWRRRLKMTETFTTYE